MSKDRQIRAKNCVFEPERNQHAQQLWICIWILIFCIIHANHLNNRGCQCDYSLTFRDQNWNSHRACQRRENTGRTWCYTTGWGNNCGDLQSSKRYPNNLWSYSACSNQGRWKIWIVPLSNTFDLWNTQYLWIYLSRLEPAHMVTHCKSHYQARALRFRRACALRALGLLLADGTPTVGGGKTFWAVSQIFLRKQL